MKASPERSRGTSLAINSFSEKKFGFFQKESTTTMKQQDQLLKMRHSCEHVLTQAMLRLYPGLLMAMGPAIDEGFYFDFDPNKHKISEADFPKIEREMAKIIQADLALKREEISSTQAEKLFAHNPYKQEWLREIKKRGEKPIIYRTGRQFVDLCIGPHVSSTGKIGPFKLLSVAGAYWHGDEKNKMLARIYGTCFATKKELDEYLKQRQEATRRDHRKLNQILKLYQVSDYLGPGLVTLLPHGTIIAEELEKWAKETEKKWGYVRVMTPHIAKEDLYRQTGHVPYYLEHMYPPMKMEEKGEGEKGNYFIKPMNCSMHNLVFKSEPRSYRDLPLRIAEYGTVYRYEKSGELHGMMRVRGPIHQNDAHIFCTEEQAGKEFQAVMDLHRYYYQALGLTKKDYYLSFAIRGKSHQEKYLGDDQLWAKAEKITLEYIKKSKIPYEIEEGEAAFYGPKIDFNIRTVTGKIFSASTNQIDFFIPRAFNLEYTDQNGQKKVPVCIHRAPLGAHVRFIAFLTEHFAGAFPVWLAPVQVMIIPITDKQQPYAAKIQAKITSAGLRAELDSRPETIQAKIRAAELQKIPYMLILGPREVKKQTLSVRQRGEKNLGSLTLAKFLMKIKEEVEKKQ